MNNSQTVKRNIKAITKISVDGFKSIAEQCTIDICPLTILAGVNSSGKSSIMQPFLMLKQTLEAPYDPGPLKIDRPNVRFTSAEQFLSILTDKNRTDRFHILIEVQTSNFFDSIKTTFRKGQNGIELFEMTTERTLGIDELLPSERFTLYPDMAPEEIKKLVNISSFLEFLQVDEVKRSRCFLSLESSQDGYRFSDLTSNLESSILDSIHLPGLRGNPERTYTLTSTGPRYPGTFEDYAASIIQEWQETKDERLKTLTYALHTLGLTQQIHTRKIGDIGIEVQVARVLSTGTGETDMVNIADVGIGVSQVLPALVAVIVAEPGQLVYLEQPELHLHPRAQVALAHVLADAAKRGVRVVAETHSSLLLLGIQTLVVEGDLSPELVKLHWFARREDGVTEVTSADMDEVGAYGDWPEDFDDVDLKTQSRYLNAVDKAMFGKEEAS